MFLAVLGYFLSQCLEFVVLVYFLLFPTNKYSSFKIQNSLSLPIFIFFSCKDLSIMKYNLRVPILESRLRTFITNDFTILR
jgi:hypothetical protein